MTTDPMKANALRLLDGVGATGDGEYATWPGGSGWLLAEGTWGSSVLTLKIKLANGTAYTVPGVLLSANGRVAVNLPKGCLVAATLTGGSPSGLYAWLVATDGFAGGADAFLGNVGGNIAMLTATPTVTAGAYTTGQVVGGKISLAGAARVNGGSGIIQSALVTVKTALTAPYDVLFFSTDPSNSTFTDNAACAVNVADLQSLCGVAHCTEVVSLGTPQALQGPNLALPFKLSAAAQTLYAVIVIRGGQTFASTSAIGLNVNILQN